MCILHIGTFTEEGIGFIKKQYPVFIFRFIKNLFKILFCFSDIF